jgi:phosphatidate cytidylyltransferase
VSNIVVRTITGIFFVSVLLGAIVYHPYSLAALMLLISLFAMREFFKMASLAGMYANKTVAYTAAAVLHASFFINFVIGYGFSVYAAAAPVFSLIFIAALYSRGSAPFLSIAGGVLSIIYAAAPVLAAYSVVFSSGAFQPGYLVALFLMVWANDTGAYLFGMGFGRTKLFERVSPKKTWEGAIGGALAAMGVAAWVSVYITEISLILWVAAGAIVAIFANFGDLVESMFKRSVSVKDSGTMLPGHGGVLDRFDGVLLALPVYASYLYFVTIFKP